MTMTLIETKTLGTAQAAIEFTSIPQTYTDLLVVCSLRHTGTGFDNVAGSVLGLNGSSTGFSFRWLFGTGSGAASGSGTTGFIGTSPSNTATSNTFGNTQVYIPNYTGSTNKSYSVDAVAENNATLTYSSINAGLWSNTAAITSLSVTSEATNLAIGSTISLYGILKGSSGGVVVS